MKKRIGQNYSVPGLEKGLDALEALAAANVPESLTQLARQLNRTSSELFRMIAVLERRGYIARDLASEGYHLTLKLYELAHTHSPVNQLLKAAALPMQELSDSILESCHLCVLSGSMLTVIAQAESPEAVRLSVEVGYTALPLNTVSGRLMVAFLNCEEREAFLESDMYFQRLPVHKKKQLRAELTKIQNHSYHIAPSSRRTGLDVSCLVGNPRVGVLAALGVPFIPGGPNHGKERKLIPVIQRYANRITTSLGLTKTTF